MAPIFKQAAEMAQTDLPQVIFAEVDGDNNIETSTKFNIHGFPTVLYFEKGSKVAIEYHVYKKSAADILKFLKNQQWIPPPPQAQRPNFTPVPQHSPSQPIANLPQKPFKSTTPRHAIRKADANDHAPLGPTPNSKILQLNPQNFNSTLASYPYVFIDFYYPKCQHCMDMAPIFAKAANSNTNDNVKFATFNGRLDESLLDRYSLFFII